MTKETNKCEYCGKEFYTGESLSLNEKEDNLVHSKCKIKNGK